MLGVIAQDRLCRLYGLRYSSRRCHAYLLRRGQASAQWNRDTVPQGRCVIHVNPSNHCLSTRLRSDAHYACSGAGEQRCRPGVYDCGQRRHQQPAKPTMGRVPALRVLLPMLPISSAHSTYIMVCYGFLRGCVGCLLLGTLPS